MHSSTGNALAKNRKRTPSGQYSRAGEREYPPAQVRRLRDAAMSGLKDAQWGTELGRLLLEGAITDAMYAAGRRWAERVRDYHEAIDARQIRSGSMVRGRSGEPPDPDSDAGQEIVASDAKAMERFGKAHAALLAAGRRVESVVRRVCENGEMICGYEEFMMLRTGLLILARHWDLTNDPKSVNAEKAR